MRAARADLDWLAALPGHKVLLKGNHDYWWSSRNKVRAAVGNDFTLVQGDAHRLGDLWVTGTRLWDVPGLDFGSLHDREVADAWTEDEPDDGDERLYLREMGRLERAMDELDRGRARHRGEAAVVMTHYPPLGPFGESSDPARRILQSEVDHAVFGHLHAVRQDLDPPPFGGLDGTQFHLTACDYLDCRPKLVLEL